MEEKILWHYFHRLFEEKIGWVPSQPLVEGMQLTYAWIKEQVIKLNVQEEPRKILLKQYVS